MASRGAARGVCLTAQDDRPPAKASSATSRAQYCSTTRAPCVCWLPARYVVQEPFAATQSMTKDDVGKMFEGEDEFGDYPEWTKTVDQINEQVCRIATAAAARASAQTRSRSRNSGTVLRVSVCSCTFF